MRFLQFNSNKSLNLLVATLCIFGSNIQNVKAEGECSTFEKAMKKLGQEALLKEQTVQVCCDYSQVTCENTDGKLHITEIKLEKINSFQGESENEAIEELSNLPFLSTLEIINSNYGKIPGNLDKLTNLKVLKLSGNNYHETLPPKIGNLTNLEVLDISKGFMTGSIPKEYCNLVNLRTLNLSEQRFSGVIPYCFKDLKYLESLYLNKNLGLKGYVPNFRRISDCDYKNTELCTSEKAICRSASKTCNENDIKSTNSINGNPNPDSNEIDDVIDPYSSSHYPDNYDENYYDTKRRYRNEPFVYIYGSMLFKEITFLFIGGITALVHFSSKKEKKNNNEKENNNNLINDSNVTLSINSTESTKKTNNDDSDVSDDDKAILLTNSKNQQSTTTTTTATATTTTISVNGSVPTQQPVVTPPGTTAYVPPTMPGTAYDPDRKSVV